MSIHSVRLSRDNVAFLRHLFNECGFDYFEEECIALEAIIKKAEKAAGNSERDKKVCKKCGCETFNVSGEGITIYKNAFVNDWGEILKCDEIINPKHKDLDHVYYHCAKCEHEQ